MSRTLIIEHNIGDIVGIDRDLSVSATITAILWRGTGGPLYYEASWIANGAPHTAWIEEYRILAIKETRT